MRKAIFFSLLPALIVALLYWSFLGYRSDYLGHYLAGFGGTLAATMFCTSLLNTKDYARYFAVVVLIVCLGSIALGTYFEATIFRIAKFDEVDYCNQSLGATLAGLCAISILSDSKPQLSIFASSTLIGAGYLLAGFYYAFH